MRGRTAALAWESVRCRPLPHLQGLVTGLTGYREQSATPISRHELPHPGVMVILELGPPLEVADAGQPHGARHPGGFVAGLYEQTAACRHRGTQSGIELGLTLQGARRLLGVPLSELTNRAVSLVDLLPRAWRDLPDRLRELAWPDRLRAVDAALLARLGEPTPREQMVAWAVRRIAASAGRVDVGTLVRELGYSHTQVARMFADQVGVPPRRLARLVRFDALRRRLQSTPTPDWATLARELGFSDQSHLAREVRRFSGQTPTSLSHALRAPGFDGDSVQDGAPGAA